MDIIQKMLYGCSAIFGVTVLFYVYVLLKNLWEKIRYKSSFSWKDYNPIHLISGLFKAKENALSLDTLVNRIFAIVILIGLINIPLMLSFSSTQIGAFYEKRNYQETYEATLFINEKPIFCIADMEKYSDKETGTIYYITEVYLPYGKSQSIDTEYFPNKENEVYLGAWGHFCPIVLNHPISDTSFDVLKNTVISNYGEFCGSKQSDKFHFIDCPIAKNIERENLIYFENEDEADILGYEICEICSDRY